MAEAVSTVVLLATDVEENEKLAHNLVPAAQVVKQCSEALVSIGEEVVGQWRRALDDETMAQRTQQMCDSILKAGNVVYRTCRELASAPKDVNCKRELTEAAKEILLSTTQLLQLADLYESLKLIKYCEAVLSVLDIFENVLQVLSDFNAVAQDIALGSVEVAKLVAVRLNFISHSEYVRRLRAASDYVRSNTESLILIVRESLERPTDAAARTRKHTACGDYRKTLEEIIEVTRLSSRDLMDRLNLNFDPLIRKKLPPPQEPEEEAPLDTSALEDAARRLAELLRRLRDAVQRGDKPAVDQILKELQAASPQPIDPVREAALGVLANPASREAQQRLQQEAARLLASVIQPENEWASRKGMEGDLDDAVKRLLRNLQNLRDATTKQKPDEAIQAARELAKEIPVLEQLAERLASLGSLDPERAARIREAMQELRKESPLLIAATKAALAGNDPDALQRLLDALERARRAADALRKACQVPAQDEIKSIRDQVKPLLEAAPLLARLGQTGELQDRARDANTLLQRADQVGRGQVKGCVPPSLTDPWRNTGLMDALARLKAANEALQAAANRPRPEPQAVQQAAGQASAAMDAVVRNVDTRPTEALVDLAEKLQGGLETAALDARRPDPAATMNSVAAIRDNLDLLEPLAAAAASAPPGEAPPDPSRLRTAAAEVRRALDEAADRAIDRSRNGVAEESRFEPALLRARQALDNLTEALAENAEERLQAERERMRRAMGELENALRTGNREAADTAMGKVADSLAKQRALAKAVVARTKDPRLRKQLLDAALEMQNAVGGVLDAARLALAGAGPAPSSQQTSRALSAADALGEAARQAAADGRASLQAPQEGLDAAAADIRAATRSLVPDAHTAEGRLFGLAKALADEMAALSAASKSGKKRDIIEAARRIATLVAQVLAQAQEAASQCTDARLSETLLTHAQAAKNFAVQLKIITAVKAATTEDDPTVKAQLVKCAKQLATSMIKAVQAAEVTKLRQKK
jgi:hypothetical protein